MKVEMIIKTKEGKGYRKPMETEETTEITLTLDVSCYVEAQRIIASLFPNRYEDFEYFDTVCID